jgi:hypothetical protein
MEDREWMYTGRVGRNDVTPEWIRKTGDFVERAYDEAAKGASLVPCPCSKCANRKRKLSVFRPRGVPGPTSKLSPRVPAQMGRRETEHGGGKRTNKGESRGLRVVLRPGRVRLQ